MAPGVRPCPGPSCLGYGTSHIHSLKSKATGRKLKTVILARVYAGSVPWKDIAYSWVAALPPGSIHTTDELTDAIGDPPNNHSTGAVVNAMLRSGLIEHVEWIESGRPNSHASRVQRWRRS